MQNSKLVDGKIPAHTMCPFKNKCTTIKCHHGGISHKVAFSCGMARAFDLVHMRTNNSNIYDGKHKVTINGVDVSYKKLREDVLAAKKKGFSGCYTFTPETVESLLNVIEELHGQIR
jgi:hypothetical protein